jgi:hypothetical protein
LQQEFGVMIGFWKGSGFFVLWKSEEKIYSNYQKLCLFPIDTKACFTFVYIWVKARLAAVLCA